MSPGGPHLALGLTLADLGRLDRVREALALADPEGRLGVVGLQEVRIAPSALDDLVETVARHLRATTGRPSVKVVADAVTIRRDGADVKAAVVEALSARFDVELVTLRDGHATLHADEPVLAEAARRVAGADAVVSVGGGTITDVAKIAAMRAGVPAHVAVQTAASVDGFTDNVSVILQDGVKRTVPSRWPEAVIADGRIVAQAPRLLTASGFGELLSMFVAPGDWFLASCLGHEDGYSDVPIDLLRLSGAGVEAWSAGVGRGEVEACQSLAAALAMRGIVTGISGSTAVLSGMEHLISHMLDMHAAETGGETGLHGAQVGVASVVRAAAWEEFRDRMDAGAPSLEALMDIDGIEARLRAAFGAVDPTGALGATCWGHYARKLVRWSMGRDRVAAFLADWPAIRDRHDKLVRGSDALAGFLRRAGAPLRPRDLDPGPSPELFRWAVASCQFMRERFTVADLLLLAGWWDEAGVDCVLGRAEEARARAEAGASPA